MEQRPPDPMDLARAAGRLRRALEDADRARAELARKVRDALADGMSISEIARVTNLERLQVRRMRDAGAGDLEHPARGWSEHPLPGHAAPIIRRRLDRQTDPSGPQTKPQRTTRSAF